MVETPLNAWPDEHDRGPNRGIRVAKLQRDEESGIRETSGEAKEWVTLSWLDTHTHTRLDARTHTHTRLDTHTHTHTPSTQAQN